MSINVTVHGNPISIKKGKMVTCDTDSEFDRRRRIRLQQVRQQSKEIAADVRNRVRQEKEKLLSKEEQKGEQDLKRWQARKLLSLQQQYQDCLKEVGSAHTKAALEPDADEILDGLHTKNQVEADIRHKAAIEKIQHEDTQKRLEKEKSIENKKNVRKTEDTRSAMVTKLNQESNKKKKKKKRKKMSTDVTIMNNLVSESDTTENFISDGENISANIKDRKQKKKQKIVVDLTSPEYSPKQKKNKRKSSNSTRTESSFGLSTPPSELNDTIGSLSPNKNNKNRIILSTNTTPASSPSKGKHKKRKESPKKNTKISDRIQQRKLLQTADKACLCDCNTTQNNHLNFIHNIENPGSITRGTNKPNLKIESYKICDIQCESEQNNQPTTSLPYVPTTTLRPDQQTISNDCQPNTCKYYDHLNRFSKEYNAQPVVQKISKNSIQVQPPSDRSESSDLLKTMQARDKIAHNRGVRALEKEKIHKDYKQLMDELPLLQRQERLASMRTHNPAFHMPEERLQELERRKQIKIENIFEKYYNKSKTLETPLVTIRPVQKTPPAEEMKLPFRALDVTESPVQLNVAEWKSEDKQDIETGIQDPENDLENRQKALVDLLQRVNKQRELLLQEVSTLPPTSNLQQILQDEDILKLICPCPDNIREPPKISQKGKTVASTRTSPLPVKSPSKYKQFPEKESQKRGPAISSNSDSSSDVIKKKKHKKVKSKKQKILIKNEGTQTSPLISKSKSPSQKSQDSPEPERPRCSCVTTTNIPDKCPCDKLYNEDAKKLCEIIIKMNNQTDVKVCKDDEQSSGKKIILNVSKPTKITVRSPNNGNDVSSSTTYMSLPEGSAQQKTIRPSSTSKQRQQYKDLLHHKPQQTNIDRIDSCKKTCSSATTDSSKKEITPTLLRYIQKLLSMSRQSIDELTVSSISDVSTPGTSVVETIDNTNPFIQLQNVMQYYKLSFNDIQKHLASSEASKSSVDNSRDISIEAQQGTIYARNSPVDITKEPEIKRPSKDVGDRLSLRNVEEKKLPSRTSSSRTVVEPQKSSSSSSEKTNKSPQDHVAVAELVQETFGLTPEDLQEIPYANILSRYKDLTKTCCDRITKLTEMIDNVRLEKERLLSPEASDRYETSVTSYLDLPKMTNDSTRVESNGNKTGRHSNASSTNSSMSQDAVDRYLLAVDRISSQQTSPTCPGKQNCKANQDVDELPVSDNNFNKNSNQENFVPMLQGIPKYNEPTDSQPMNFFNSPVKQFLLNAKTKPPPSLLRNANKYNLNIDMTPHELSTIVELDTIVSSRNVSAVILARARSPEEKIPRRDETVPEKSKQDASGFATLTPEYFKRSPEESRSGSCDSKCSQRLNNDRKKSENVPRKSSLKTSSGSTNSSQEQPVSNTELSGVQPLNSDRSTSSPEDMETILRNMGLGWAVSTLKKTHEAMALSSSSSSVEASFRKRVSFKNSSNSTSNSDVSLKDVLSKGLMKKISSSTLLTETSGISPHLQDIDLSEIRDPTVLNRDGSQHRTSTPVHQSRSTDSKKDLFTGDSDISSVRLQSEEFFLSIPNVSLDTNKSLGKSKD